MRDRVLFFDREISKKCLALLSSEAITKAGVLHLPCFRCATSACGSFSWVPYRDQICCRGGLTISRCLSCRTWKALCQNRCENSKQKATRFESSGNCSASVDYAMPVLVFHLVKDD